MYSREQLQRTFTRYVSTSLVLLLVGPAVAESPIDRQRLVERHTIVVDRYMPESPVQLGNGEFAFALDFTGLQTFPSEAPGHIPLGCMTQWSWHTMPESKRYRYEDTLTAYDVHGRQVTYATDMRSETAQAIRSNPHRFNLARIGLRVLDGKGDQAGVEDLADPHQEVSLWTGESVSRFEFDGKPVVVRTVAHPTRDAVGFEIESPLLAMKRVAVEVAFAYPAAVWGPRIDDWESPERHASNLVDTDFGARIERKLDETTYAAEVFTEATVRPGDDQHVYVIETDGESNSSLSGVVCFVDGDHGSSEPIDFAGLREASAEHWKGFWMSGGAVDLSGSSNPRWRELERRIVLSQYLTAINCAGSMPPQETGLLCNSWFGKSHLEMHWWHAAHFALWGRFELLEKSLGWYDQIMPAARSIAERQGYRGVRWPKMTGPHGVSSPSEVGELLIWQQPHPIYFAELAYREDPSPVTLARYRDIVYQTVDFMADYAHLDPETDRYVLGPVLIPAQECYDGRSKEGVMNPAFELAYWRWALRVASEWSERLGETPPSEWREVAEKIAPLHVRDGVYTAIANPPFTRRRDHPSMLGALGILPEVGLVDHDTMRHTLDDVGRDWQWDETWGWDYPMAAMTAARLGHGDPIALLMQDTPKNHYLANGHCRQEDRLPVYLPANGGLLMAIAMMAEGWDSDQPLGDAPGFPRDGSWSVRHEGLSPMP